MPSRKRPSKTTTNAERKAVAAKSAMEDPNFGAKQLINAQQWIKEQRIKAQQQIKAQHVRQLNSLRHVKTHHHHELFPKDHRSGKATTLVLLGYE